MPQPWDRQADESDQAHAAFVLYRDLGAGRSVDAAYAKHGGHEPGSKGAPGRWKKWAAGHRWRERATAWDNRQQQAADKAITKALSADAAAKALAEVRAQRRLQQENDEWRFRELLLGQAEVMLKASLFHQKLTSDDGKTVEVRPAKWSKFTAMQYVEAAMKLGRTSAQMPAVPVADEAGGLDEGLYDTKGQLAAELPADAVPEMPADTFAKPDLSHVNNEAETKAKRPDKRNRERP